MEMIQDLLNPTADNLPIREEAGPAGGVFVAGAAEVPVTSLEECLHYLELGEQNRRGRGTAGERGPALAVQKRRLTCGWMCC